MVAEREPPSAGNDPETSASSGGAAAETSDPRGQRSNKRFPASSGAARLGGPRLPPWRSSSVTFASLGTLARRPPLLPRSLCPATSICSRSRWAPRVPLRRRASGGLWLNVDCQACGCTAFRWAGASLGTSAAGAPSTASAAMAGLCRPKSNKWMNSLYSAATDRRRQQSPSTSLQRGADNRTPRWQARRRPRRGPDRAIGESCA